MKRFACNFLALGFMFVLILGGCSKQIPDINEDQLPSNPSGAPLILKSGVPDNLKDTYIVAFKDDVGDVDAEVEQIGKSLAVKADFVYKYAIRGFAATLPEAALNALKNNPHVKYIEQNQVYQIVGTQSPATWGLDRIDQRSLPLNTTFTYTEDGTGVDAYIIDTGILQTHVDFGGRAVPGYDAIISGGSAIDDNGHGTHVSGTVGGNTYGVAKKVKLIAVKVLNSQGSGTTTQVVAGINWAISNHTTNPAVANMSLGGGASTSLDVAVQNAVADGIVMCVAAGNSAADAANYSPARVAEAITVGATSSSDALASYSNYGSVVDILAPGSSITSDYYSSNTAAAIMSGTSMATPHVTGTAALYLASHNGYTPAQVANGLKAIASSGKISGLPAGTPNLLLYSLVNEVPAPTFPDVPVLSSPANGSTGISVNPALTWNPSGGAVTYGVQISANADLSSPLSDQSGLTTTSVNLSGLSNNTVYYWRANATNANGTSAWSSVWNFTTVGGVPPAPVLKSPGDGATNIKVPVNLSWYASTGATSYNLIVSTNLNFTNLVVNKTLSGTSSTVPGLYRSTTYYWKVLASNSAGQGSWSSARSFTTR